MRLENGFSDLYERGYIFNVSFSRKGARSKGRFGARSTVERNYESRLPVHERAKKKCTERCRDKELFTIFKTMRRGSQRTVQTRREEKRGRGW